MDINLVINDLKTQNGHSEIYYDGKLANMPTILNSLANELSTKLASVNRNYCTCDFTILGKEIHIQAQQHTPSGSKCSVCGASLSAIGNPVGNADSTTKANGNSGNTKSDSGKQTPNKANAKPNGNKDNKTNAADDATNITAAESDGDTNPSQDASVETQSGSLTDTSATHLTDGVGSVGGNKNAMVIVVTVVGSTAAATGAAAGIVYFIKKKKTQV